MSADGDVHVLIAGGGVAALEAALTLQTLDDGRLTVELLAPEPRFWYRPLAVAEPFDRGKVHSFELAVLAREAGAAYTHGQLLSIDEARRLAYAASGAAHPYTMLLLACGTVPRPAVDGALTFRGPADTDAIRALLGELEIGVTRRVAFAVPAGAAWSLPAYELALLSSAWARERRLDVEIALVTPELEPLSLFGPEASTAVRALLESREIALHLRSYPLEAREGELLLVGNDIVAADRVVALPRLQAPRIGGVPQTFDGFVAVDRQGRVLGMRDVYAAGDVTTFPLKQGGIAAQQAEAAAEAIAAAAGLEVSPRPFTPVLRGLLLTGEGSTFLRSEPTSAGEPSEIGTEPLWWPPTKIVGRRLAPFLARLADVDPVPVAPGGGVPVETEIDAASFDDPHRLLVEAAARALGEGATTTVGELLTGPPLVVAPEDTIGEVAERMSKLDVGSALVAEYGRLIGILTSRDMLRALAGRVHSSEARARQWMTAEPLTVELATPAEVARVLMTTHGIHHLPVVDGERAVGMVGLRDVAGAVDATLGVGLGF